jgi:hypothetical protein
MYGEKCSTRRLLEQLVDAKIIKIDLERELVLAWKGGHGVHAFNACGDEVSFWNVGDFAKDSATESEVLEHIKEVINTGDYQ